MRTNATAVSRAAKSSRKDEPNRTQKTAKMGHCTLRVLTFGSANDGAKSTIRVGRHAKTDQCFPQHQYTQDADTSYAPLV
jgi:hypothetical protein